MMHFPIARLFSLAAVAAISLGGVANAAIVWTGGGADASLTFAEDNYDLTGSSVTAIDPDVVVADDILFQNVSVTSSDNNTFANLLRIGNTYTVTLDNATYNSTGSGGFNGEDEDAAIGDDGIDANVAVMNGSLLNLQYISQGITVNVDSTSALQIRGGGDGINSQLEVTQVHLSPGAMLTLPSLAEFTEQGAEIFVDGVAYSDGSNVLNPTILEFNGTTATAIAPPVPEPSTLLLLGLALAVGSRFRR